MLIENRNADADPRLPADDVDFFRTEAIAASRTKIGPPVRTSGLRSWMLVGLLLFLVLLALIFAATSSYSRKETVEGVLSPSSGATTIKANRDGTITEVHAREGLRIRAGAPLASLSSDITTAGGQSLQGLLTSAAQSEEVGLAAQIDAQIEATGSKLAEAEARRLGALQQRSHNATDVALQSKRVQLARQTAESAQPIFEKGFVSAIVMRQREDAAIAAQQALSSTRQAQSAIATSILQTEAEIGRLRAEMRDLRAQKMVIAARATEKIANYRSNGAARLLSPIDGTVSAMQIRAGTSVKFGQTLAIVLPEKEGLEAELWVPSRAIGFIRPGDEVRLLYDAFPYQRFGAGHGVVRAVSRAPVAPENLPPSTEAREPMYLVKVSLARQDIGAYGKRWALSPGMRLRADLLLDDRSLLTWLLDPVLAISKRK